MEDGTCFETVRNTAHTKRYWQSSLQSLPADTVFGTFIARDRDALLWLVITSNLMPLVNYFHVSVLTKANISLNIIPVCIFHSCLVSKENIYPRRSALLWQRKDAEHYSCYEAIAHYHLFPLSWKKWSAAQSISWTSQVLTMHHAALPATIYRFACKCFLEPMSSTNSLRNTAIF